MTVSGIPPDLTGLEPIELVRSAKAQYYIAGLADQLKALDGNVAFLVHDGHTGTSDDFVSAVDSARMGEAMENTPLFFPSIFEKRSSSSQMVAGRSSDDHLGVKSCASLEEAIQEFRDQAERNGIVGICARRTGNLS